MSTRATGTGAVPVAVPAAGHGPMAANTTGNGPTDYHMDRGMGYEPVPPVSRVFFVFLLFSSHNARITREHVSDEQT
jgi:hypothetical protein